MCSGKDSAKGGVKGGVKRVEARVKEDSFHKQDTGSC